MMTTREGFSHGGKQTSDKGTTREADRRERSNSSGRLQRVLGSSLSFFLSDFRVTFRYYCYYSFGKDLGGGS